MRIVATLLVLLAIAVSSTAKAQSKEFKCVKAFPEMVPEYPKLVCMGNELLERGKAKAALAIYTKAAGLVFFESPNFFIYFRIANAEIMAGERDQARKTLKEFDDMLAIYNGKKSCTDVENIEIKARSVMCSEVFNPDGYNGDAGRRNREKVVEAYRERIEALRKQVGLEVP